MRFVCLGALLLLASPALAAEKPVAAPGDAKINELIIYGNDPCPKGAGDEIVVCARKPESDRYRIPSHLRDDPNDPKNNSWTNRAIEMDRTARSGIGSCSTSGPGGFTGCLANQIHDARVERRTRDSVNWNKLIEEARQERLSHIDADAAAADAQASPQ